MAPQKRASNSATTTDCARVLTVWSVMGEGRSSRRTLCAGPVAVNGAPGCRSRARGPFPEHNTRRHAETEDTRRDVGGPAAPGGPTPEGGAQVNPQGKLAILVGGGPAPGINSVIGAATIRSVLEG